MSGQGLRGLLGWLGQVLAWLVILGVVLVLAAAVVVPRLAGATPYTVLTGSMDPTYPPGTLVVVKPVPADDLRSGDVVTYQIESGEPTVVTHRVVGVTTTLDGDVRFITQGDANDVADSEPVRPVQLKGRVWYSVPYLGHVNQAIGTDERRIGTYVVVVALLGYAALMFGGAARGRRRRDEAPEVTEAPDSPSDTHAGKHAATRT